MAQYTVTAGCGHTVTQQLYGLGREREQRLTWMSSAAGACNACYASRKRAQAAQEQAAEIGRLALHVLSDIEAGRHTAAEYQDQLDKILALDPSNSEPRVRAMQRALSAAALSGSGERPTVVPDEPIMLVRR